jgi:hypothetical protein
LVWGRVCAYAVGMPNGGWLKRRVIMVGTKFSSKNQSWVIVEVKDHSDNFKAQLGWSHFAAIKRTNGKKVYYANLLVVDGAVVDTTVVL